MKTKSKELLSYLKENYKDEKCSLVFSSDLECLVSISLSAQTTDEAVNKVTKALFMSFKDAEAYAKADIKDIENEIKSLGLYHNKAKNLHDLGVALTEKHNGLVPHELSLLIALPGVGQKTAKVFLLERDELDFIPVDTHIKRISYRLGYSLKDDSPATVEAKLEKEFSKGDWKFLHHALIAFGRKECKAKNPICSNCPMKECCRYFKKTASTTDK